MKKLLLLFAFLSLTVLSYSQITITSNDIVNVNDSIFMGIDTVPNNSVIDPGGTGEQTWNFTNLEEHDVDSIFLFHTDETPYSDVFPSSNIAAFILPDSMYAYLTKNTSGLFMNGFVVDITDNGEMDTIIDINSETLIATPLNYNDVILDTTKRELIFGNMKINQTSFRKDTIDAYGNMTIPSGTYSSLRMFSENIQIDSIFGYSGGNWNFIQENIDTTYEYEWWTDDASAKFYICSFEYDIEEDTIIGEISYLKEVRFSEINDISYNKNNILYPNPSTGIFTVNSNFNKIDFVKIFDYTGKTIYILHPKNNIFKINMTGKTKGIYFLRINSGKNNETFKFILNP